MENQEEIWKDIPGWENYYQVSTLGRIRSLNRTVLYIDGRVFNYTGKILSPRPNPKGYLSCVLTKNCESHTIHIHREVAKAFIPNPENKPQINHLNGIKSDNKTDNLCWATQSENMLHSFRELGRKGGMFGKRGNLNKESIPVSQFSLIGELIKFHEGICDASRKTGIDRSTISSVCNHKRNNKTAGGYIWKFT